MATWEVGLDTASTAVIAILFRRLRWIPLVLLHPNRQLIFKMTIEQSTYRTVECR